MFKRFPEIKRMLWWWEFWSDWWYIGTVWEWTNEEIVRKYIANQVDEKGWYMGKRWSYSVLSRYSVKYLVGLFILWKFLCPNLIL
jgi:hypothetical protein